MEKLSERQQEVIDLMRLGWVLRDSGLDYASNAVSLRLGNSPGERQTKRVHRNTLSALQQRKLIERDELVQCIFPGRVFRLTKSGSQLAELRRRKSGNTPILTVIANRGRG